jgi:hypothetical protein
MKRFSANQLDLFESRGSTATSGVSTAAKLLLDPSDLGTVDGPSGQTSSETSESKFPDFGAYTGTQAETARIAARIAASQVSDAEYQAFLHERQNLLDKLFSKTITRHEEIRLEYVRWSLDRIEDAKHGSDLDRIEDSITRYEHFLEELDHFKVALDKASKSRRR